MSLHLATTSSCRSAGGRPVSSNRSARRTRGRAARHPTALEIVYAAGTVPARRRRVRRRGIAEVPEFGSCPLQKTQRGKQNFALYHNTRPIYAWFDFRDRNSGCYALLPARAVAVKDKPARPSGPAVAAARTSVQQDAGRRACVRPKRNTEFRAACQCAARAGIVLPAGAVGAARPNSITTIVGEKHHGNA